MVDGRNEADKCNTATNYIIYVLFLMWKKFYCLSHNSAKMCSNNNNNNNNTFYLKCVFSKSQSALE